MKKTVILILICIMALNIYGCKTSATSSNTSDSTESSKETSPAVFDHESSSYIGTESAILIQESVTSSKTEETSASAAQTSSDTSTVSAETVPAETASAPAISAGPEPVQSTDFVAALNISHSVSQIIVVSANGSTATVSMHETDPDGIWKEIMSTSGHVGKNGVGKASENDTKTPAGVFGLTISFGIKPDPGTALSPYRQVTQSDYWVDDPASKYYNQFVSTDTITPDWNSAEHIIDYTTPYAYCIAIDYNLSRTPGDGSAIFLHCSNGNATAGCVSVPESKMIFILTHIRPGCVILIDNENMIGTY